MIVAPYAVFFLYIIQIEYISHKPTLLFVTNYYLNSSVKLFVRTFRSNVASKSNDNVIRFYSNEKFKGARSSKLADTHC